MSFPSSIHWVTESEKIAEWWRKPYILYFNCAVHLSVMNLMLVSTNNGVVNRHDEVCYAIECVHMDMKDPIMIRFLEFPVHVFEHVQLTPYSAFRNPDEPFSL